MMDIIDALCKFYTTLQWILLLFSYACTEGKTVLLRKAVKKLRSCIVKREICAFDRHLFTASGRGRRALNLRCHLRMSGWRHEKYCRRLCGRAAKIFLWVERKKGEDFSEEIRRHVSRPGILASKTADTRCWYCSLSLKKGKWKRTSYFVF